MQAARRRGVRSVVCLEQMGKLVTAVEECPTRSPRADPPEYPGSRTRFSLRTAILIFAPSAIVIVVVWLGSVAGLVLVNDQCESGPMYMIGGTAVAVTAALVECLHVNLGSERDVSADRDAGECHAKSPSYEREECSSSQ